jgi:hypothetical protein
MVKNLPSMDKAPGSISSRKKRGWEERGRKEKRKKKERGRETQRERETKKGLMEWLRW